jgi:tubulin polyglutamylase TTLL6/13
VKPDASCQGRGIFLTKEPEVITPGDDCVVQVYMRRPHLINGFKYDLRVYVLVASGVRARYFYRLLIS